MEPLKLTFTTFLKISASTPRGMIRELRTFMTPGGYDFYKVMKRLNAGIASGAITFAQAEEDIAQIVRKPEREHTLEAVRKFHTWFAEQDLEWHTPPKEKYTSESEVITVRLEPELAFKAPGGIISILYLWNLNKPELKAELAGEGLHLLMNNLIGPHYEFGIYNLRKNKIIGAEAATVGARARLQTNLRLIEEVWTDIHNPAVTTDEAVAHISAFRQSLPPAP